VDWRQLSAPQANTPAAELVDKQPEIRDLLTLTRQGIAMISNFEYELVETALTFVTTAILAAIVPWSTQCVLQVRVLLFTTCLSALPACLTACLTASLPALLPA